MIIWAPPNLPGDCVWREGRRTFVRTQSRDAPAGPDSLSHRSPNPRLAQVVHECSTVHGRPLTDSNHLWICILPCAPRYLAPALMPDDVTGRRSARDGYRPGVRRLRTSGPGTEADRWIVGPFRSASESARLNRRTR
jgi:hypothetical protein